MKPWNDDWRCTPLRLYLRDDQLFQGETVNVQVYADVVLPSDDSQALDNILERSETPLDLLQRWRDHCDGARVYIQIVEVSENEPHGSSSAISQATLFQQKTQVSHVSLDHSESETMVVIVLNTHFDLKIDHKFWDRPVLLVVHMLPKICAVHVTQGVHSPGLLDIRSRKSVGASLLRDEWVTLQLLSLTREKAQTASLMTRCVEQRIVVTKPLQLEIESRELVGRRVGILVRVSNTHSALALAVRDLQLHLDQSSWAQNTEVYRFRIVSGGQVSFPVLLQPQERYNFLFVLAPIEDMVRDELPGGLDDNEEATSLNITLQKKLKSPNAHRKASTQQHTSLTLSWQAITVPMDAITETRSFVWSPQAHSHLFSSLVSGENEPQTDFQKLVTYLLEGQLKQGGRPHAGFTCVRLLPNSVLQTTIAPFASTVSIGDAVKVCAKITNHSMRSEFDLTLVLPRYSNDGRGRTNGAAPAVVGFESSHRLGLVRPGMSIRQCLHVAFLRLGNCRLGPLVLVDHLSRTCFVSDDWEVFVRM